MRSLESHQSDKKIPEKIDNQKDCVKKIMQGINHADGSWHQISAPG